MIVKVGKTKHFTQIVTIKATENGPLITDLLVYKKINQKKQQAACLFLTESQFISISEYHNEKFQWRCPYPRNIY